MEGRHQSDQVNSDGTDQMRRRWIRRDLAVDAILAVLVGLVAFVIMPPADAAWPLWVQGAIATGITIVLFGFSFVLWVLPEILSNIM